MPTHSHRRLRLSGMDVLVFSGSVPACAAASAQIVETIKTTQRDRGRAVLGLATGSTPVLVYEQLVQRHLEGLLSFRDVSTYNLDEYYPISPFDLRSYRWYMHRHLLSQVDIAPHRAHLFDGTIPEEFASGHAKEFDRWIEADGGLDLQLLGIGRNGHLAFNEPSSIPVAEALKLGSRLVELHPVTRATRRENAGARIASSPGHSPWGSLPSWLRADPDPRHRRHKASVVARALNGPITAELPASLLQSVGEKVTWMLDEPAASAL